MDKFRTALGQGPDIHFEALHQGPTALRTFLSLIRPLLGRDLPIQLTDGSDIFFANTHDVYYGHLCFSDRIELDQPATYAETLDQFLNVLGLDDEAYLDRLDLDKTVSHRSRSNSYDFSGLYRPVVGLECAHQIIDGHRTDLYLLIRLGPETHGRQLRG